MGHVQARNNVDVTEHDAGQSNVHDAGHASNNEHDADNDDDQDPDDDADKHADEHDDDDCRVGDGGGGDCCVGVVAVVAGVGDGDELPSLLLAAATERHHNMMCHTRCYSLPYCLCCLCCLCCACSNSGSEKDQFIS